MAEARVERRLAAILAADIAGYSRLMGVDEEGTLAALKACRREIIDPKITEHRGRIVKTTGDGALVEFGSAVDSSARIPLTRKLDTNHTTGAEQQKTKVTPAAIRRVRHLSATFDISIILFSPPYDAFAAAIVGKVRSGKGLCSICRCCVL
jgi:class 3 adenylate cyclase